MVVRVVKRPALRGLEWQPGAGDDGGAGRCEPAAFSASAGDTNSIATACGVAAALPRKCWVATCSWREVQQSGSGRTKVGTEAGGDVHEQGVDLRLCLGRSSCVVQ